MGQPAPSRYFARHAEQGFVQAMFFAGFADPAVDATGRRLSLSQDFIFWIMSPRLRAIIPWS